MQRNFILRGLLLSLMLPLYLQDFQSSLYGGYFQPGCLIYGDPSQLTNAACMYQHPSPDVQSHHYECMSGFYYLQNPDYNHVQMKYCIASCNKEFGLEPNIVSRECSAPNNLNSCGSHQFHGFEGDCQQCDQVCLSCSSQGTCNSCANGYYTKIDQGQDTRVCEPKDPTPQATLRVFVAIGNYDGTPNDADGTDQNPFYDIRDALAFINQSSAPYKTRQVVMYLEKGTHYITLRETTEEYELRTAEDYVQAEYGLTIQPLYCSDTDAGVTDTNRCYQDGGKVRVMNKIGSYFTLDVPASLTITNVIFDAIDSMGSFDLGCLGQKADTCSFDTDDFSVNSEMGACCSEPTQHLETCNFAHPTSLIRIKYTNANKLDNSKQLTLQNTEFKHFFYPLNSLIQYPMEGARVEITNSKFEYFSTCGSVISNQYRIPYDDGSRGFHDDGQGGGPNTDQFSTQVSQFEYKHAYPVSIQELDFAYGNYNGDFMNPYQTNSPCYSQTSMHDCYSLTITGSTFQHFDIYFSNEQLSENLINDESQQRPMLQYKLYTVQGQLDLYDEYRAPLLLLKNFPGEVHIDTSTFNQIRYPARTCYEHKYAEVEERNSDNSPVLYSKIIGWKTEMPIIITDVQRQIVFAENTVSYASGSKGFLFVSRDRSATKPVVIHDNTFSHVSGFTYSGIINVRSNHTVGYRVAGSDFCGGVHIASNKFQNSVMCSVPDGHDKYKSAGLIKVSCLVDEDDLKTDEIYDDPDNFWSYNQVPDVSAITITVDIGTSDVTVDTKITTIKDNTFTDNLRGAQGSLIFALQIPFIRISGNTYTSNGDVVRQHFSSTNLSETYGAFNASYSLAPAYGQSSKNTGAMISIFGGLGFSVTGETIGQKNWKQDLISTDYATYLHSYKVRGEITIEDMTVTTPPEGVCSSAPESLVSQSLANLYYLQCTIDGPFQAQARESFIKIEKFNQNAYYTAYGIDFQTIMSFKDLDISNLYNYQDDSQAFVRFNSGGQSTYNKIKLVVSNLILDTLSQRGNQIFDLRGMNTQISQFTAIDIGSSQRMPDYIFLLGDISGGTEQITTSISTVTFTSIIVDKDLIDVSGGTSGHQNTYALSQFTITNCQAQYTVIQVDNDQASVNLDTWTISNTKITDLYNNNKAEFLVTKTSGFTMNKINHSCDIERTHCRVLRFYKNSASFSITNSNFTMVENNSGYQLYDNMKQAPFFVLADTVTLNTNRFSKFVGLSSQGGVFKAQVMTLTDQDSLYFQNTDSTTGGVYYLEGTGEATFTDCEFYENSATNAGVIQLADTFRFKANGCDFYQNQAGSSGGVLRTQQGATFQVQNCHFYENTAGTDSAVIYSFSNEATTDSLLKSSFIYHNRMPQGKNTIVVLYSQLTIDDTEFYENLALEGSHGIYTAYSTVSILNSKCYTKDTENFQWYFESTETTASVDSQSVCLTVSEDATVNIQNTIFENLGDESGAISLVGYVVFNIADSTFSQNQGASGAAIHVSNFYTLNIQNCTFSSNSAWNTGSDIFVENSSRQFSITDSRFTNTRINSIYVSDAALNLQNSNFTSQVYEEFANPDQQYTIICENCNQLNLVNNRFEGLEVDGVIGLRNTSLRYSTDQSVDTKAYFEANLFSNIQYHTNGGGIGINSYDSVLIRDNTFQNIRQKLDTVALSGAAIYSTGAFAVNMRITENRFINNQAAVGGAIAYNFFSPQIEDTNTFSNNEASSYGHDLAGYPTQLAFISEDLARELVSYDYTQAYTAYSVSSIAEYSDFKIEGHRSGNTAINFYIAILDKFGQIVESRDDDKLTVGLKVISASNYAPVATTSVDIRSESGIFNVSGLTLIAEPDTTVTIELSADSVFTATNPDVIEFKANNGDNLILSTTVQLRACIEGESFMDNGECSECPTGTSYLLTVANTPTNCLNCPNNANCFGGSQIGPQPGYWRSSAVSVNFMTCFLSAACLGRLKVEDDPLGNCAEGYRGMFCAQCIQGYTRSSTFECAKCPEQWKNILILVGVMIVAVFLIVILVKSTLNAAHSQRSPFAIYVKVMINHLQLIFLTSSFDLSWPDQVNSFYAQTQPVANVSDKVVSLDCFLDGTTSSVIGRFYLYLLTYLLLPFLVTTASLCFWWIKIRKNKKRICSRSIGTIIILLFLLHPTITNTMFQTFLCRDVDGTLRLVQELDQTCWQGKHFWWALLGGFPGLICWALGIPAFAWLILREHKKRLHNLDVKEKYGFLYKGYKVQSYYWECVIMYRKVAMIFISVFLNGIGTMVQALVVMVLLVFFIIITQRYKPYYSRQLNDLELISLVTSCITFYCGLFFLSSKSPSDVTFQANRDFYLSAQAKWVFFFVIVFANLIFLVMWVFKFLGEVRQMFRKKCTGLYVCLCLCCRRGLLVEDIKNARHNAVKEIVIETIEKLEHYFRKLRHMYIRGSNFVDKPKFEKMVHTLHHDLEKLNTNKVLLDQEAEQPAFKGNIRMHAALENQYGVKNKHFKEEVDNQEISKISFSLNDKEPSIFVIEEEDALKEKPQPKGLKLLSKMINKNLDIEEPQKERIRSPDSQSVDQIRISDRRKQVLMTDTKMTNQNSSDFGESARLNPYQRAGSDESKEKSETQELKVDMRGILEDSTPDQEVIIVSDLRENVPLQEPEQEVYTKRKISGYTKLRKNNEESGVPMFDEGLFDVDAKRPRIQTQKIIKINPSDLLRANSEDFIEYETSKVKKQGERHHSRQKNKVKITVHSAREKEFHHKVRNSQIQEINSPIPEQNDQSKLELDTFVNELQEVEEPEIKSAKTLGLEMISEGELLPQSTRMGFMSNRNMPRHDSQFSRQDTIARMEAALNNKNYKENQF